LHKKIITVCSLISVTMIFMNEKFIQQTIVYLLIIVLIISFFLNFNNRRRYIVYIYNTSTYIKIIPKESVGIILMYVFYEDVI
jgi:hypothetical protein